MDTSAEERLELEYDQLMEALRIQEDDPLPPPIVDLPTTPVLPPPAVIVMPPAINQEPPPSESGRRRSRPRGNPDGVGRRENLRRGNRRRRQWRRNRWERQIAAANETVTRTGSSNARSNIAMANPVFNNCTISMH